MGRNSFKNMTGEDSVALHVKVTKSQHAWLSKASKALGKSQGNLVRLAIQYAKTNSHVD